MRTLSFTGDRQRRYPAPDVARGFMLALIALANVPFWIAYFSETPRAENAALEAMNGADQWWYLVQTLVVDRRAYPLFLILFGFGMAIMASRLIRQPRLVDACLRSAAWHRLFRRYHRRLRPRRGHLCRSDRHEACLGSHPRGLTPCSPQPVGALDGRLDDGARADGAGVSWTLVAQCLVSVGVF